jgi:glycosyltransferase involved in cell wall biosynthesis
VRSELNVNPDTLLIGLVARLHPMKDHETFLRAAALLHAELPEARFLLVGHGTGPDSVLASRVKALGLQDAVKMLGERADVVRLTAALDIACCTSYSEGFPNSLGEAMACEVPCVTTDVGDCATLVADTGVVIPTRSPAALVDAWRGLHKMGAAGRRALGRAARTRIAERFDMRLITRQYERLYERVGRTLS